jgi:CshA-type fibril repeat protein
MNLALGASETDATLGAAAAIGTILDPFVDANETAITLEDKPINGNVIDAALASSGRTINLTTFQVAGDSTTYNAGQSTNIAGVGTITIAANGDYTFTPVANYNGTVPTVTYSLSDDSGATVGDTSTLNITVTPVNDPPIDGDEIKRVERNTTLIVSAAGGLLANTVADVEGSSLSIIEFTVDGVLYPVTPNAPGEVVIAGKGKLTINSDGSYRYEPVAGYTGEIPVATYVISDGNGGFDTSTLTLRVPPIVRPAAVDDEYSVLKGGTVTLTPLRLDSHPDGVNLGIVSINGVILTPGTAQVIQVTEGTVNVSAAGEITFTPNASFTGTVTIPYVISDGQGGTATANEIITVKDNIPYVRNISQPPFIAKPFEHPPLKMGYYEFNTVVLDFNGAYGGINQFSLPHGETTLRRGALQYSNHTPYVEFDRVGDELQNAQRTIDTNAILSPPSNEMLPNSALPPDEQLDSSDTEISIPPPSALVGGKGDIKFTAYTKNGKPLPDWVKFNRVNGNFEIFSSDEAMEPVEIQVIGTDTKGNQAETKPNNKPPVKPVPKTAFVGKESLTSQIKSALTFGKG